MPVPVLLLQDPADPRALAAEAAAGLLAPRARVSPKFFYDLLGSRLFDAITALEEYYPTRTEAAIFEAHGAAMAAAVRAGTGPAPVLVDVGAGNGAKAARLFGALVPRRYVAVDISAQYLGQSLAHLQREHPAIEMAGVGLDFSERFHLPASLVDGPALMFFPGSSIGNFDREGALRLLREMREASRGGALLVGVDLVKPREVLERAYDDALGVTAAFNLNVLRHLSRLLGADFRLADWRHVAFYDAQASRIEMHLEARRDLVVRWPGAERRFAAGERIHTENSAKFTTEGFAALLREAGYAASRAWTDAHGAFAVFVAAAR